MSASPRPQSCRWEIVEAMFGLIILAALIAGAGWFPGFIEHSRNGVEHGCKRRVVDPMD